jgi:hypothetical protein
MAYVVNLGFEFVGSKFVIVAEAIRGRGRVEDLDDEGRVNRAPHAVSCVRCGE